MYYKYLSSTINNVSKTQIDFMKVESRYIVVITLALEYLEFRTLTEKF